MDPTGPAVDFLEAGRRIRAALDRRPARRLEAEGLEPAAVLIPMLNREGGATLLFTRRTETVNRHKGQISFPGGRAEPGEDAVTAALREAREEVGLAPGQVRVAGCLDDHPSVTRYIVTPVVALVEDPPPSFRAQEAEVVEVFEAPLARLLDRDRLRWELWPVERLPADAPRDELLRLGRDLEDVDPRQGHYRVYFFAAGQGPERLVWGLTARILKDLLDRAFGFSAGG